MAKFEVDIPVAQVKRVADTARLVLGKPELTDADAVKALIRQCIRQMVGNMEGNIAASKAQEAAMKSAAEITIT